MSEPTTPNERDAADTADLVSDERVMWQWSRIDDCLHGRLSVIWFARAVIDDYRAALAAQRTVPAAPVAWRYVPSDVWHDAVLTEDPEMAKAAREMGRQVTPLYAHPQASTAAVPEGAEAVAIVCDVFELRWIGSGPIAPIVERHGLKVGSKLYAHPPRESGDAERYRAFFDSGLPVCFMGQEFRSKEECDKAIDAAIRSAAYQGKER